jgi:peroxisomal 3,2-trans-enoyl-CoA isomerase
VFIVPHIVTIAFAQTFIMMEESTLHLEYRGRVAVLTIDNERKLNAFNAAQYYNLAQKMREIATHEEIFTTVILAKGRYFSA